MPRRSPMQRQRSDKLSGSSNCRLWRRPAPTRARRRKVGWDVRSAPMCRRTRATPVEARRLLPPLAPRRARRRPRPPPLKKWGHRTPEKKSHSDPTPPLRALLTLIRDALTLTQGTNPNATHALHSCVGLFCVACALPLSCERGGEARRGEAKARVCVFSVCLAWSHFCGAIRRRR